MSKDPAVDGLLCERAIPALDDPVGFRLFEEADAGVDAPGAELVEDVVRQILAAVVHPYKDVKTFDQMALALHYHMFQLVVVANSGQYGGSNAYWPRSDAHIRQVFHTHGQPQASIAFLEIDDIGAFLERHDVSGGNADDWKHPPAGLKKAAPGGSS